MRDISTLQHTDGGTPEEEWITYTRPRPRETLTLVGVEHLLVLAAHPGDETLMAGGLMALAHMSGIRVDVVVATDGEASHPHSTTHTRSDLARLRRSEVLFAVRGLAPEGRAKSVLAVDWSASAIRLAAESLSGLFNVEVAQLQVPEELEPLTGDLVVISKFGYF